MHTSGPQGHTAPRCATPRRVATLLGALLLAPIALAESGAEPPVEPTRVEVRVLSKGAKFVGTSMGGAQVLLRDAETGEMLARGVTAGTTGSTARILGEALPHHAPLATPDAAVFRATLDLEAPRRIQVEVRGPRAQPQAGGRATATMWLVPGRHVEGGDGWRLELPGLVVDVLDPPAHRRLQGTPQTIRLRANVTMMCGCPLEPGGPWDPEAFEVRAIVSRDGAPVAELPLEYAGSPSQFGAALPIAEPGVYAATVFAHDPGNGNTGLDRTTFVVTE